MKKYIYIVRLAKASATKYEIHERQFSMSSRTQFAMHFEETRLKKSRQREGRKGMRRKKTA